MLRRNLCQIGMAFLLGVGWKIYDSLYWCPAFAVYVLWILLGLRPYLPVNMRKRRMLFWCMAFLLGSIWGMRAVERQKNIQDFLADAKEIEFQGEIYKKEKKADQPIYYLRDVILRDQKEQMTCSSVILYPGSDDEIIGSIYIGKARIQAFRQARNDGNYDELSYYESSGIAAKLEETAKIKSIVPRFCLRQVLYDLRGNMARSYENWLPGEESGVMKTLALGERDGLDAEVKSLYQMAGLSHILAISGLHISVVGMAIYNFLRRRGTGFFTAGILAGSLVVSYGILCGMGSSTKRAVFMYGIYLLANVLGEVYDSGNALMLAGIVLVVQDPLCMKNTGVIFSFVAVLGVISFASPLVEVVKGKGKAVDAFVFSLGLQLFTLPLVARFYYEIPLYSIFLNLVLLPLLGLLLGCGLIGGLVGLFWQGLAGKILTICHVLLYFYEWMADLTLRLPGARQIVGAPAWGRIFLYYGLLYLGLFLLKSKNGRTKGKKKEKVGRRYGQALLCGLFGLVFLFCPKKTQNQMVMLDVGQGDGIYLQSSAGDHFFIDGGSTDVTKVGTYRILPFLKYHGIRKIDYWFVSHTDLDHINGLQECLESGYEIEYLVFAKAQKEGLEDGDAMEKLIQTAKKQGSQILYMEVGDRLISGGLRLQCVGPTQAISRDFAADGNAMSLCLLLTCGDFQGLFTGDIAMDQESSLVAEVQSALGENGTLAFLKVAHHGSKYSSGEDFLDALAPKIALISCGKNNSYGHPGKETLERLEDVMEKDDIYITMDVGQIRILFDQESPAQVKFAK